MALSANGCGVAAHPPTHSTGYASASSLHATQETLLMEFRHTHTKRTPVGWLTLSAPPPVSSPLHPALLNDPPGPLLRKGGGERRQRRVQGGDACADSRLATTLRTQSTDNWGHRQSGIPPAHSLSLSGLCLAHWLRGGAAKQCQTGAPSCVRDRGRTRICILTRKEASDSLKKRGIGSYSLSVY